MAWLEGKLSGRDLFSWYDNMQEDRSEAGMMAGVKESAVFLLFLTQGTTERYFVQREMSEAFKLRKPIMLLYETDDRFGRPDFQQEAQPMLHSGPDGKNLVSQEQLSWLFGEIVGIPVRREAHELSSMLDEIETHARHAIQEPGQGKAKIPPVKLCGTATDEQAIEEAAATSDGISTIGEHGTAALLWAAEHGDKDVVSALVSAGASVDVCHPNGRTPLSLAEAGGHVDVVALLRDAGGAD